MLNVLQGVLGHGDLSHAVTHAAKCNLMGIASHKFLLYLSGQCRGDLSLEVCGLAQDF